VGLRPKAPIKTIIHAFAKSDIFADSTFFASKPGILQPLAIRWVVPYIMTRKLFLLPILLATTLSLFANIERTFEKSFTIFPGNEVEIDLPSGSIEVTVGDSDQVEIILFQKFKTNHESEADEWLSRFEISVEQNSDAVRLIVKKEDPAGFLSFWKKWNNQVNFSAKITVPAQVDLRLDTAGGQIRVSGDIDGDIDADTAGGSIKIDGATGHAKLDTAGGSITAGSVYGSVHADTAGGSITISYVGPDASRVYADTAGGGITIGLDASGKYSVEADTSGGSVSIDHSGWVAEKKKHSYARGDINGGGAEVHADTSGGSIRIREARP